MKIGVISDTHLHQYSLELQGIVDAYFSEVEVIFHAGDIVEREVLFAFSDKKVEVVAGNMDPLAIRKEFPTKKTIKVGGFTIGLIHGWGSPLGIERRLCQEFGSIDCLVYGHTHYPVNQVIDGILFFNPGSATEKRFTKKNTIGILEVDDRIKGEIIEL
ncbi:MAG: metallophosphatase family protein [Desulfobacterota bacterium]|nr:metallophosphatase family protein [Thermodesulfobacteriota bacterium]